MGASLVNRQGKIESFHEVQHAEVRGLDVKVLPEGVTDFATWGRTHIQFGKSEGKNMSYLHLANSQSRVHAIQVVVHPSCQVSHRTVERSCRVPGGA